MTLPYRKKLIEVGLPLVAINAESAREKSIRHGHPSTLHPWWARRPLAACRAVLFSSFVDDPDSDPAFHKADGSVDEDRAGIKRADLFNFIEELVMWENSNNPDVIRTARAEIARCVASRLIETGTLKKNVVIGPNTTAYDLVKLGHCKPVPMGLDKKAGRVRFSCDVSKLPPADVVNAFLAEHAPPVLDPFAGGGSIPLEAQRLGLRAYASDLNPVPVLINKALIEIPPKFAGRSPINPSSRSEDPATKGKGKKQKTLIEKEWHGAAGLAEDVRYYGHWMREEAEKRIGHLYPKVEVTAEMAQDRSDLLPYVGQQLTVIAWLWARTVASPNPACGGAHVPLVTSFALSTKAAKNVWIEPIINRSTMSYRFTVRTGEGEAPPGTVNRVRGDRCLLTNEPITREHIRSEGRAGRLGVRLMAIVTEGNRERVYLSPNKEHESLAECVALPTDVPDTDIVGDTRYLTPTTYGMTKHSHLFTARQLEALRTFCNLVGEAREKLIIDSDNDVQYANAVTTYLGLCASKASVFYTTLARWRAGEGKSAPAFGRQAIAMVWDFTEVNPFAGAGGDFAGIIDGASKTILGLPASSPGFSSQADAASVDASHFKAVFSTDPPYYDNVPYADLSDYFYIWLRICLQPVYPELLGTVLVPKAEELVADPFRQGSKEGARAFFEQGMAMVAKRLREASDPRFPTTIYYAFKQAEENEDADDEKDEVATSRVSTGWETFLQGLADAGWQIDGTWPMRTEGMTRMRNMGSNALASSIVLVCRPRPSQASLTTRKDFINALRGPSQEECKRIEVELQQNPQPNRRLHIEERLREGLPIALRNLQRGNIAPVDLAQAAIGPGMAVFTRYSKVLESDGSPMTVRTALGLINQTLDEVLAEQEGEFDGDTRWALAWFEQFGIDEGPFGDAETLSKAKNTAVNGLVEAGVIKAHAGKVRLLRREELPADWNPATDKRIAVWEVTQHLIRTLDQHGELRAAALVEQLGGMAEIARDLAYRLYSTCERKKWAEEAMAYNGLVIAWPELTKLALAERTRRPTTQQGEFF